MSDLHDEYEYPCIDLKEIDWDLRASNGQSRIVEQRLRGWCAQYGITCEGAIQELIAIATAKE